MNLLLQSQLEMLCHTPQSILRLGEFHRELVEEISSSALPGFSPHDCKPALWAALARKKILVPKEVFDTMEADDSIEMWAVDETEADGMRFVFAFGAILTCTSYSIEKLATTAWSRLFGRDATIASEVIRRTQLALATGEPQFDIADWHDVVELESDNPKKNSVLIKSVIPYSSSFGERGIFALVKCAKRDARPLRPRLSLV